VPRVRARAAALAALGVLSGPDAPAGGGAPAALDVVVVGGGQAALAVGYYLRRSGLSYALLDAEAGAGGAWRHAWPSLRLFSPAQWSSLPGWLMPRGADEYPTRGETLAYLAAYEARYALPVVRPVRVSAVRREGGRLRVEADAGTWMTRAVVSATGTWRSPVVPDLPGRAAFGGLLLHSADYPGPGPFAGRRVIVVGAGNSGAQIAAELAEVATMTWATREPPRFLPAHVDGRYLFEQATARWQALREGRPAPASHGLGDIVLVEPVRRALARGLLQPVPMFARFTTDGVQWPDGREASADAVIWATGFRPALAHLDPLGVRDATGRVALRGTRAVDEPRLWLVGYGDWTGFASATLIGVGRTARETVREVGEALGAGTG
jgi:putative flavoprotein involved in K+ transport